MKKAKKKKISHSGDLSIYYYYDYFLIRQMEKNILSSFILHMQWAY